MIAFGAGVSGVMKGTGIPTGAKLVAAIVSDQPGLRGIVTDANVGGRGRIGVGQSTEYEFVAVGHTPDGALVRYTAQAPQGLSQV